jgi:type IV pilus assembly protein PilW
MQKPPLLTNNCAFSLVEMMVAMAVFSIVMAGIITAFHEQLRMHTNGQRISGMQQNARTALHFMASELKMAGFDPTGMAGTRIQPVAGRHDAVTLSMDVTGGESDGKDNDGDGVRDNHQEAAFGDGKADDSNEVITYALKNGSLKRASGQGAPQTLAVNIDALDVEYFGTDPLAPGCGKRCRLDLARAIADPNAISAVQVSIIASAGPEAGSRWSPYDDHSVYRNQQGKIILDKQTRPDRKRRLHLSTEINIRNQGLK